jgi:asparagine synthase (glutamine-hydrolysing)
MPEPELAELLRAQLLEATRLRLRSDVAVGAFLSGGVDSSAVVAAMARSTPGRLKTFSVGFDVADYDETDHARDVSHIYDTEHHQLDLDAGALDVLPRLVWHYGEPFADSSAIPCFHLAELAGRHVTVALAGDGGDESFAGYHRYERVASYHGDTAPRVGLRPEDDHVLTFFSHLLSWDYFGAPERPGFYTPEFLAELGEQPFLSTLAEPHLCSDAEDDLGRIIDVDLQTRLSQDILVKVDIASMAHSLEVRSPLLDQVLLETAAAIPSDRKLRDGNTKRILKDALRDWLPDRILDRTKMGFAVPLGEWLRTDRAELPRDVLLDPSSLGRGIFRAERVHQLLDDHRDGVADHAAKIWALLSLELWLQTFVDPARASSPVTV